MARPWVIRDSDVDLYLAAVKHVVQNGGGWPWGSSGAANWIVENELSEDAYPDGDTMKGILESHFNRKALDKIKARVRMVRHRRDNILSTIQVHTNAAEALSDYARETGVTLSVAILALTALVNERRSGTEESNAA